MTLYRTVTEVLADRRKGVALSEIIDSLLTTPQLWEEYGTTPFSLIPEIHDGDYVDMSTESWRALPVETQMKLAKGYQWWYAHQHGLWEPEYWLVKTNARYDPDDDPYHQFTEDLKIRMILIPPMRYWMGTPEKYDQRHPKITLVDKAFWLGKYTITQRDWVAIHRRLPYTFSNEIGSTLPMTNVSWEACKRYCKRLDVDLPTEEQWELACRAGTTTKYSFGDNADNLEDYAWYRYNSGNFPHPVSWKAPNAFGLFDMHGNIWEWCENKYRDQESARIYRGGSFGSPSDWCYSESYSGFDQSLSEDRIGFRIVKPF